MILFDMDGTLTNPKLGITTCVQYALSRFGIHETDIEKLVPFIGPPLKESFMGLYGFNEDDTHKAVEFYRERFATIGLYENELLSGIAPMLEALKNSGKIMVVATSKPLIYANQILKHFDILKFFKKVYGPDLNELHIGKAEIIRRALAENDHCNAIMVGDRKMDINGAKENGIKSVGVRFGFAEKNELELAGADYIVNTVKELEQLLLRL